jgi:predicted DNA binding CopG/RHH family protein
MKTGLRDIPTFASEDEEALFWQKHDSSDYVDWDRAQAVILPELKPSLRSISLRLPEPMLARLRTMANERDVPYQSLIKIILAEHLAAHIDKKAGGVKKSRARTVPQ